MKTNFKTKAMLSSVAAILLSAFSPSLWAEEEVNIYSYRKPELIDPMFEAFTKDTGIKVNVVFAKKGMLERLKREGRNTPADLVFTVDIGRLADVKSAGLTQAVESDNLNAAIPSYVRDTENHWFGLTQRARFIVVSKNRVKEGEVLSYEDLAKPSLKGRICTRSGKHAYMVALTAGMMAHHGNEAAEIWLSGVKANLARKPQGNDRGQVKAIKEGECDVAVINHYYMYKMLQDAEQTQWANAVNVIFPNQAGRGTHMNISGMAMTKHAKHPENALKLMKYLASDEIQKMYADLNGEYPVKERVKLSSHLARWGEFKRDTLDLTNIASNRAEAIKMTDRVAYDD
ncbi:MAG: Fe(3+) ABC transporter substrate-binding protein [Arenicellales bacterium]